MQYTSLILIRHAHPDQGSERLSGWFDAPLSWRGYVEVDLLRERIASEPRPHVAYTSTSTRASETASVARAAFGIEPEPLAHLREICCGSVDGWLLTDLQQRYPDHWERNLQQNDDSFRWPEGESYREFRVRVLKTVRSIAARRRGQRVLIFTHAGVISQLLGALHAHSPAHWGLFRPGHASITELRWGAPKPQLIRFDDRDHLR